GPGAAGPYRPRKLIQHGDQRKPAFGTGGPRSELSRRALPGNVRKPLDHGVMRATAHPPDPVFPVAVSVDVQRAALGEPEIQNVAPCLVANSVVHATASVSTIDGRHRIVAQCLAREGASTRWPVAQAARTLASAHGPEHWLALDGKSVL